MVKSFPDVWTSTPDCPREMPVENRFYLVGQVGCCCLNGEETAFYQRGLSMAGLGDAASAGLLTADGNAPWGGGGRGQDQEHPCSG